MLEDLHWIDAETEALLGSLIDSLPGHRIMLLLSYRPDYRHGWSGLTYYTQLHIDPLGSQAAKRLVTALLGHDPSLTELKQTLIHRTEGNPLFIEEMVRRLVDTAVLKGEPGRLPLRQAV